MHKLIYAGDQEDLLKEAAGQISFLFERGDRQVKTAASSVVSRQLMLDNMPDDQHFGVHLIAMGAGPYYTFNKNGDDYPEAGLKHKGDDYGYQTFVKYGRLYREHRNDSPKKSIGVVKAAAYNDAMHRVELIIHGNKKKAEDIYAAVKRGEQRSYSMSCFPAGTLVWMADGTEKPIEKVLVGDVVLTHTGNTGGVSHVMYRDYSGDGKLLHAYGLPEPVTCTADHKIWARRRAENLKTCPVCRETFKNLQAHLWQKTDSEHRKARQNIEHYTEGFVEAKDLQKGDYVRQAVDHSVISGGSKDWAVIYGYYLAEGSISAIEKRWRRKNGEMGSCLDHRTEFCFHENESAYIEELNDAIERCGFRRPSVFHYPKEHRRVIRSHDKELYDNLLTHCGKYSHEKCLNSGVMQWEPELQKIILEKWLEGDGTWSRIHKAISGTTVSRRLAWQMLSIAARLNLVANVGVFRNKPPKTKRDYYIVEFRNSSLEKLNLLKKPNWYTADTTAVYSTGHLRHQQPGDTITRKSVGSMSVSENGFIYRKLRKAETVTLTGRVYDLTIPGDHSFVVHGIGVSNCRVPHDVCSCCGHEAPRSSDYCVHLKRSMTRWLPQFSKFAYAINPKPKFFDISDVVNPADRIAHYLEYMVDEDLKKSASERGFLFSDELAELAGVRDLEIEQRGCLRPSHQRMLIKLAAAEDYLQAVRNGGVATDERYHFAKRAAQAFAPDPHTETQLQLCRQLPPDVFFYELAKRAAVLPFLTFCAYATGETLAKTAAAPAFHYARATLLPGMFRTLANTPVEEKLEQMFHACDSIKAAATYTDAPVQATLDGMAEGCSVLKTKAASRLLVAPPPAALAPAAPGLLAEADRAWADHLTRAYGNYKIALASDLEERQGAEFIDDPLLLLLLSRH